MLKKITKSISNLFRSKSGSITQEISSGSGGWSFLEGILNSIDFTTNNEGLFRAYTNREKEQMYSANVVVFACVRKIYQVSEEPALRLIEQVDSEEFETIEENYALDLINNPNPEMDFVDFQIRIICNLFLTGKCYILKMREGPQISEIWPLPTSWVSERVENGVLYFNVNGIDKTFTESDIFKVSMPDPRSISGCSSPLEAVSKDIQIDDKRKNFLNQMLTNLKLPGLVVRQGALWDNEQKEKFRRMLGSRLSQERRGDVIFLTGEDKEVDLDVIEPLKDLDWPGLSSLGETLICAAFGVPPILLGLRSGLDRATYSNYEQAEKSFYRSTMIQVWNMLSRIYTNLLFKTEFAYEDIKTIHFKFDLDTIKQLQEDIKELSDRAVSLWKESLITRNEARSIVNLEPLDPKIGDVLLIPGLSIERHISEDLPTPEIVEPDTGKLDQDGNQIEDIENE